MGVYARCGEPRVQDHHSHAAGSHSVWDPERGLCGLERVVWAVLCCHCAGCDSGPDYDQLLWDDHPLAVGHYVWKHEFSEWQTYVLYSQGLVVAFLFVFVGYLSKRAMSYADMDDENASAPEHRTPPVDASYRPRPRHLKEW